ncbi:pyridoxal phosphate-dependent transferase [Boeremia exigua]|uniref:pyridoxal phosphate-dependent transferase n=1 Tax=Boeremia exigua TaxID=749465 RepID=UPI001E8EC80E|nr:pyridoxal phosphate-dependent transferase [Boeremia exigua]KAH6637457.1 pyridoxal phosphate-dependent transferase [Boeremia exigua]
MTGFANGNGAEAPLKRSEEVNDLLNAVQELIIPFIAAADHDADTKHTGHGLAIKGGAPRTALVEHHPPKKLESLLHEQLKIGDDVEKGKDRLIGLVDSILKYSVNTWDQGFMDKLYASTNAVGVVAELLLAVLNTNVHVYQVSPVLTLIEKATTKYLASLFGYPPEFSGGISQPGGSASNSTAIVIARNTLYPETKTAGNGSHKFTLFTSAHGHYSLEKAANLFGLGTQNVIPVPVDATGRMLPSALDDAVRASAARGETPFFVNATAGTTVHGSFDPLPALSAICRTHNLWLHLDGSWGGSVIFNPALAASRLEASHLADSIAVNPHKMLGAPITTSFLLGRDMRTFHAALTLPAGYLFHNDAAANPHDIYDLADLTPQCGRRADSLKFFLALQYYGPAYFSALVARAFENAEYLLAALKRHGDFATISPEPLPCLQVCFYFARGGVVGKDAKANGKVTEEIAHRLIPRGFMVDYAPGEKGKFFRVVVNGGTRRGTLDGLVKALVETAGELGY